MTTDWPPSLKPIAKYMKRAHEVENANPIVAYYCNHYSLKKAVELRDKQDESATRFLTGLLDKCDAAKASIGPDDGTHRGVVEEFALHVFDQADTEDRQGQATRDTALTFFAAMCFIEVCSVFGPLAGDLEERAYYAKWKAGDILKALREGRTPLPGPPSNQDPNSDTSCATPTQPPAQPPTHDRAITPTNTSPRTAHGTTPATPDKGIPPAPEVREYESDLQDYQPNDNELAFPPQAPPYPSSDDPSPIPSASLPPSHPYPAPLPPPAFSEQPAYHPDPHAQPPYQPVHESAHPPFQQGLGHPPSANNSFVHASSGMAALSQQFSTGMQVGAPHAGMPGMYGPGPAGGAMPPQHAGMESMYGGMPQAHPHAQPPQGAPPPQHGMPHGDVVSPHVSQGVLGSQPAYRPGVSEMCEAKRFARHAVSALDFQDVAAARLNLEKALRLISG